jgi:CheY-like chemotaxis protein
MSTVKLFKGTLAPFVRGELWSRESSVALEDCSRASTERVKFEILDPLVATRGLHTLGSLQILVVEDFEPFGTFLGNTLSTLGFTNVVQARDGEQAIQLARELQPDLILLDLGLPKLSGLEVAKQVRTISPQSQVLIVSSETLKEIVEEAMAAGARGYVFKYCAHTHVALAIRAILNGETFISPRST